MMIPFVLLRVPIIFVLDEFYRKKFNFMDITSTSDVRNEYINGTVCQVDSAGIVQSLYSHVLLMIINIIVCCTIYWSVLYLISLPKAYLKLAYGYVIIVCIVFLSVWINLEALKLLSEKYENIKENAKDKLLWDIVVMVKFLIESPIMEFLFIMFRNILVQYFLSLLIDFFSLNFLLFDISGTCFLFPVFFVFIPTTQKSLNLLYVLICFLPMLRRLFFSIYYTTTCLIMIAFRNLKFDIKRFGIFFTINKEWKRNNLPSVLQLFWAMRLIYQYLFVMPNTKTINETIQFLLINGCDTFITFSGMVFFFSSVLKYFELCITKVLFVDHFQIKNFNKVFIILFYMMACQTRLMNLKPEERFNQLYQNVYLLCSLLPLYIHNVIRPLLIYSTYFDHNSLKWHPGALLVCGTVSMFSFKLLIKLWAIHSFSLWLLVVSLFNCQTNIHLLLSLVIYSLYLTNCLRFDDYVTYSKIFGSTMNFFLDIFYLFAGVYIIMFEPFGVIRAIIICLHVYNL